MNGIHISNLVIIGLITYAIGNINPSIIIAKLHSVDIRTEGSGNPGTTNVIRVIGLKAGILTLAIDLAKAFIAVRIGLAMESPMGGLVAFAGVVLGHCFPIVFKFKGGKGVAATIGAGLALNWMSAIVCIIIALVFLWITKRMSIASLVGALIYPLFMWFYEPIYWKFAVGVSIFLILMHIPNIKRLINGEEKPLTVGKIQKNGVNIQATDDNIDSGKSNKKMFEEDDEVCPVNYFEGVEVINRKGDSHKIGIIGNGSFGTAIANMLVYNGHEVTLYGRNKKTINSMKSTNMNEKYLPYVILSNKIKYTSKMKTAVKGKDIVIFAVPAQSFREVSKEVSEFLDDAVVVVNLAKGIEKNTLKRMSEVASETIPNSVYVALSGPTHAEEIARNLPASVVVASKNKAAANIIQDTFMSEKFRVYTHDDLIGVEICGAVKNVIAIATGISDGMKLGSNARAALMTRALHEMKKLAEASGANVETLSGLSGIGDLIVTCSTNLSRNRRCGILIGLGLDAEEAVKKVGSVVEGYYTADALMELAEKLDVEMPVSQMTYNVLKQEIKPEEAISSLMTRSKKDELE